MSIPASPEVYIGAWRNYADGNTTLTLTLRDSDSLILIAALVVFTGFVASRVFGAVQFILHQARADGSSSSSIVSSRKRAGPDRDSHDALHQRQQALLRNSAGHAHTFWLAIRVAWGWKLRLGVLTAFRRSLVVLVMTLLSMVAWTAAQLLLPLLWAAAANEMLAAPTTCGQVVPPYRVADIDAERRAQATDAFTVFYNGKVESAANHQRRCPNKETSIPECQHTLFRRINWTVSDGGCPVTNCFIGLTNSDPISLDSGFLNTNTHFGLNAPLEDTIDFQYTLSCVSMNLNREESVEYIPPANGTSGIYHYLYGNTTTGSTTLPYTISYNESLLQSGNPYEIISLTNYTNNLSPPLWSPAPFLFEPSSHTNASLSIHFLASNSLTYPSPVMDPLFQTFPFPSPSSGPPVVYAPAHPVTILVCKETHRFCSPIFRGEGTPAPGDEGRYCSRLSVPSPGDDEVFDSRFNAAQKETGRRLRNAIPQGGVSSVIQALAEPLVAGRTIVRRAGGFGAGWEQRARLPVDQWRVEVERWFEIGLVLLQMGFVEWGQDVGGSGLTVEEAGCGMQRVGGVAGARNLNLVSIIGTVAVGIVLLLLSVALKPVVGWWQRRKSQGGQTGVMQWKFDGLFQMQRLVYEAAGVRGWDDGDGVVPTTSERVFSKDVVRMRSTF